MLFSDVNAHSCYQCSSEDDPECMENFDTGNEQRFLVSTDCDVNAAKYCVKTTGIFGGIWVQRLDFAEKQDLTGILSCYVATNVMLDVLGTIRACCCDNLIFESCI